VNVDIEVYNQAGTMVFQKIYEDTIISLRNPGQFAAAWTPTEPGTYTLRAGAFTADWKTNYAWNNNAGTITVTAAGTTIPPTNPPTNPPATTTPPINPPATTTPPINPGKIVPTVATVAATNVTQSSATLNGSVNMNGGNGRVWFQYGIDSVTSPGKIEWKDSLGVRGVSGNQMISVAFNNLKPNTTYYYKVLAENYTGTYSTAVANVVSFKTATSGTTNPPATTTPPGAVKPTVATLNPTVRGTSATLVGTVNIHGGSGHVWFEYTTNPQAGTYGASWPWTAGTKGIDGSATSKLSVKLSNLKPGTTYYYRINAERYEGGFSKSVGEIKSFTVR